MATHRRRRTIGATKDQAPRARGLDIPCNELLRATCVDNGYRWEQRCAARTHGNDERHLPGEWVAVAIDEVL